MSSCATIMLSAYPTPANTPAAWLNPAAEADMKVVKDAIHDARSLRSDKKIPNHVKVNFSYRAGGEDVLRALSTQVCTLLLSRYAVL